MKLLEKELTKNIHKQRPKQTVKEKEKKNVVLILITVSIALSILIGLFWTAYRIFF